jgi:hypothetical protein
MEWAFERNTSFLNFPVAWNQVCCIVDADRRRNATEKPTKTMQQTIDQLIAEITAKSEQGNWVPACGGTETPFRSRSGKTLLYCWQPSTGRHAYLDCGTDIILSHEEATAALAI